MGYLKRNIEVIHKMRESGDALSPRQLEMLSTIEKLYAQQNEMFQNRATSVKDRIVSISQPHIRPIVRGKEGTPVEFGAKINMSVVNGYVFLNDYSTTPSMRATC